MSLGAIRPKAPIAHAPRWKGIGRMLGILLVVVALGMMARAEAHTPPRHDRYDIPPLEGQQEFQDFKRFLVSENGIVTLAIFALSAAIPLLLIGGYVVFSRNSRRKVAALLERDGVTGVACVVSFEKTSVMVNYQPRVRFQFDIQPDAGGPPIRVEKALIVTVMDAPRLQVGMTRKVRYLPSDPKTFHFED